MGADPLPPPPRWLRAALVAALAVLLVYPVHVPYQVSDQDWVPSYSLFELVRGGWAPWNFHYTSALTNLVRLGYATILGAAHLVGYDLDAVDLLVAWMDHPAAFRVPVRLIGMGAGVLSLIAAMRLGSLVAGPWAGMTAAALLGTAFGFVREHHGGMFDPPAVAAASWSAVAAATYVVRPRLGRLVAAGALAGLAVSFKQSVLVVVLGLPLAAAVATGPARERLAALVAAAGAAGAVLLATSPGLLLDPARFLWHQNLIRQALYSGQPPDEPRALWAVLRRAAGLPLIVAALFGVASAVRRRERALVPVLGPAVLLCASALGATFLMNRYALPLLLPCAVFAAYGLHWSLRSTPLRAAVVALLVAMALPSCLSYLRLLAVEDTRVAAARWLAAHVRPGAVVVWSMSTLYSSFYGPDVPARPRLVGLPSAPLAELERKMGGPVVPSYRFVRSWRPRPGCETCADLLRPLAGALVVTAEPPATDFVVGGTPPDVLALLSEHAILLHDWPIERVPATRTYERRDFNFVPLAGAGTLLRPGPRLRAWYVPPLPGASAELPVDPSVVPPGAEVVRLGDAPPRPG